MFKDGPNLNAPFTIPAATLRSLFLFGFWCCNSSESLSFRPTFHICNPYAARHSYIEKKKQRHYVVTLKFDNVCSYRELVGNFPPEATERFWLLSLRNLYANISELNRVNLPSIWFLIQSSNSKHKCGLCDSSHSRGGGKRGRRKRE